MQPAERELAEARLREIAAEIGLPLSPAEGERLLRLLESVVDGTRDAAELGIGGLEPALAPSLESEEAS